MYDIRFQFTAPCYNDDITKFSYKHIFKLTKGVPRLINLICHQALLAAYSESKQSINPSLVIKSSAEVLGEETKLFRRKVWQIGVFTLLNVLILVF